MPTTCHGVIPVLPLLNLDDVSLLLRRSAETIKSDLRRNPNAVPPCFHLPGTRLLRWREEDVSRWLSAHAVLQERRNQGGAL